MRVLRPNHHGHDVATVQHLLIAHRLFSGEASSRFDDATTDAVLAWQARHNLLPSGIVDAPTLASMIRAGLDMLFDRERDLPEPPEHIHPPGKIRDKERRYGTFQYRPTEDPMAPDYIDILDDFEARNIVDVPCPLHSSPLRLHKDVAPDYLAFAHRVVNEGLKHLVLSRSRGFSKRFQNGSHVRLSAHAWGIAFDLNLEQNPLGCTPPYEGQPGSVRALVRLANLHNFYWGGHHRLRRDGSHFEHVV